MIKNEIFPDKTDNQKQLRSGVMVTKRPGRGSSKAVQ